MLKLLKKLKESHKTKKPRTIVAGFVHYIDLFSNQNIELFEKINVLFENKKVRTADINPILHKIAHFNRVNRKNKKRDKSKKEDLSRCVLLTNRKFKKSK